ncbi:PQ loop repeat-domain-containing protein [Gigaspora rosea]|uniref:PQ loop repeat-domain-containing protein n=1 Tax=Gigaspora rosea TaxID=44941 RepID=A0A397W8I4_9GLOM|nr:PQ loop repeat-domain-containing protein [Gigaspora rosea]
MNVNHSSSFVILENTFGLIGLFIKSVQLVPQAYKNWRNKSTGGLSFAMLIIWALSSVFMGIYSIVIQLSIPLIIQPQLFTTLSLICFVQCLYYDNPYFIGKKVKTSLLFACICIVCAVFQSVSTFGIRVSFNIIIQDAVVHSPSANTIYINLL